MQLPRRPFALLTTVLWITAAAVGFGLGATVAAFSATEKSTGNSFTADVLDAASSLSATGGTSVTLNWTATSDSYAAGHRVYRASNPGGPYTQIAEITPRTTTTYEDTPSPGTYYYVVRAYGQGWQSAASSEASATVAAPPASGVTVDSTGGGSTVGPGMTWPHTVGAGSDRLLVVGLSKRKNDKPTLNVTYGGAPLTLLTSQDGGGADHQAEIWVMLAPPVGTADVVVDFSTNIATIGGSISFTGVHQTGPIRALAGAADTSTTPSVTVSSAPGDVVLDVMSTSGDNGGVTIGGGQTEQWGGNTGSQDANVLGAGSLEAGASPATTMSWSAVNTNKWASVAMSIVPSTATCATPGTQTLTASADSWIQSNDTGKNMGGDSNLFVKSLSGENWRALVRFPLQLTPAGCSVTAATLRMNAKSAEGTRSIESHQIAGSWTENAVTWANQPGTTGAPSTASSGTGWRTWSVTPIVRSWYTGVANHGFLLKDAAEDSATNFAQNYASREDASLAPVLQITFG